MASTLNTLADPLVRTMCAHLDTASLGLFASTNKKFHAIALTIDSDAGKVQTVIRKRCLFDLGLRHTPEFTGLGTPEEEFRRMNSRILLTRRGNILGFLHRDLTMQQYEVSLSQNGRFTSDSPKIDTRYICVTFSYLFTRQEDLLQVRNLDGELLCALPITGTMQTIVELPSQQDKKLLVVLTKNALQVWDIIEKTKPMRMFFHDVSGEVLRVLQCENIIAFMREQNESKTFWVYDTNNLEQAPKQMPHSEDHDFGTIYQGNEHQILLMTPSIGKIVAYSVQEEALRYSWNVTDPKKALFFAGNEKWLVLCKELDIHPPTSGYLEVLEAKTGKIRGEFYPSFLESPSVKSFPSIHDGILWGDDILVVYRKYEDRLHFYVLPEGKLLFPYRLESCRIIQLVAWNKQLYVHYLDTRSQEYRIICWNMPPSPEGAQAPNNLPKPTLIQPEYKKEASLCNRIYACISTVFDWLASILHWLWH